MAHDVCDTLVQTASGTGVGIRIGRWISRGDEGVASGLRFMPYHLLQADRRKEALSVMLDLQYVEVSTGCACGRQHQQQAAGVLYTP